MENIIEVSGLVKKYENLTAVNEISFAVNQGELFAFLGQNGAGKSTTIEILCTLRKHTKGSVVINGYMLGEEDDQIRNSIGIVFQKSLLDGRLTVEENLMLRASFYGIPKQKAAKIIKHLNKAIGMKDFLDRRYINLSGGQRRRADIARALLNTPQVLFLDEPTTGLDPKTRIDVWDIINKIRTETGMTVFLTTHYMDEASTADHILIIERGSLVAEGTPDQLKDRFTNDTLKVSLRDPEHFLRYLDSKGIKYRLQNDVTIVQLPSSKASVGIVTDNYNNILSYEVIKGSMDDVFLNVIGAHKGGTLR